MDRVGGFFTGMTVDWSIVVQFTAAFGRLEYKSVLSTSLRLLCMCGCVEYMFFKTENVIIYLTVRSKTPCRYFGREVGWVW